MIAPVAMVLAAGHGQRLRPLTDATPKPLIEVAGRPLIDHALARLRSAGIRRCVINTSHLAEAIESHVGSGEKYGMSISFSRERQALEVAGGIAQALHLLGDAPFIALNADILSAFDLTRIAAAAQGLGSMLGRIVLGAKPPDRPGGDFSIAGGLARRPGPDALTYIGCAAFAPSMFASVEPGSRQKLLPLLQQAIDADRLEAELYDGPWIDAGTPERLAEARRMEVWGSGSG